MQVFGIKTARVLGVLRCLGQRWIDGSGSFGDGTYIAVPFVLGAVSDRFPNLTGIECAVAGSATLIGVVGLLALCQDEDA